MFTTAVREQIIRDLKVLEGDPHYHCPSREFYEQRVVAFKEALMRLTVGTEVAQVETVELDPALQTELKMSLQAYAGLKAEMAALESDLGVMAAEIGRLREKSGAQSVGIEGVGRVTLVAPGQTESLDKRKLLAQGVTMAMLENATVYKPRKGFTKITVGTKE